MNRLNFAIAIAALMAVLAFVLGGWLIKAIVAVCSLSCFTIYAYRQNLWGLSLYLLALLVLYLCADILTFDDFSLGAVISYVIFCITLGGCIILARQDSAKLKVFTVLVNLVFILLPAFYLTYYVVFATGVTDNIYYAILQTNIAEALEFTRVYGINAHLPVPVLCIILTTVLLCLYLRKTKIIHAKTIKVFLLLTFVAATGWSGTSKHAPDDAGPRITRDFGRYAGRYYNRLRLFKRRTAKRDISNINYRATKTGKGETYVIAIGETLNKHHMQIYGYPRATTPMLAAEKDLLIFNNTYSNHILTGVVLSQAFTASTQYNGTKWYEAVSIIDVLQMAKVNTAWLTNQDLYGAWLGIGVLLGKQADHYLHMGNVFSGSLHVDGDLLPHVERILTQNTHENRVVFVHLMGNHEDFCVRYPPAYARYRGKLDVAIHGDLAHTTTSHRERINCYDNSVLYNDYIVSTILAMVKQRKGINGFVYFSDHGIDLMADEIKLVHNFTYEMTSIPMLMWLSPKHQEKYPHVYQNLRNNRDKLFSNDLLYDTLLGMMAIDTNQYESHNDLSSSVYALKDREALVLDGQHKYNDNLYWRQHRQITALVDEGEGNRTMPAQVNNVGKLKEAWRDGSRAFALDLRHTDSCLAVGRSNMCLQEFLSHIDTTRFAHGTMPDSPPPSSSITKLWLNIKNSIGRGRDNLPKIKANLPTTKIVVDIDNCADNYKTLEVQDLQLSCVLSPTQLQRLTADTAAVLAEQIKRQGVRALSFDARFYQQVKEHLEPRLPADVVYHVSSHADVGEVRSKAYWADSRVETVAFRYHSRFQLPVKAKQKQYAKKKIPRP